MHLYIHEVIRTFSKYVVQIYKIINSVAYSQLYIIVTPGWRVK
jgi:hypothetical protein